ncbi:MAG: hypothetical protein AMK72_10265 [Planctomycetes bacterium SM23_25]|nr:MAG: hypothetical protein AMK72_10265 [Planctomycetes bacterium SM23_25]
MLLALLVSALCCGCVVFPHGAYWPSHDDHLSAPPRADGAPDSDLSRRLPPAHETPAERDALQKAVTRRWSNDGLAESARHMDARAGQWVYADAMRAVVWFYVDPVAYRDLVAAGIRSLRAALDNPTFRARFGEADDAPKRARFAEALEIFFLKAHAADPWFAFQAGEWLAVAMEKNRAMLGLPDGAVVAEFLFGAMDSLDPYTQFLTGEMLRAFRDEMKGAYTGIGAEVASRGGRIVLGEVFEGGAAAAAGLEPGDEITAIDEQAVEGLSLIDVSRRLRGKAGTKVRISVRPAGHGPTRSVTLQRCVVHLPSVRGARLIEGEEPIGYLRLTALKSGTEKELRRAVCTLAGEGAGGLILDLRGNPGGTLLEAIGAAGVFLPPGPVTRTRGRALGATWTYDVPLLARPSWRGPLAVLINEHTASAAEVLAAALARRGRAVLVGRRTFGKGAAQINVPITGGASAVCVTVARLYDPDDACIEGRGVAPSCSVKPSGQPAENLRDDPAVCAAVEALRAAMSPK